MSNDELLNEFDVLYNSITSNESPGLDPYEKSVFLTKAQYEVVKSYFNPRSNKTQEGFDGNEKRQIDFSMIMRSKAYIDVKPLPEPISESLGSSSGTNIITPIIPSPFRTSFFDMRSNTRAVTLEDDILMLVNEYVEVNRNGSTERLTVVPISYTEYSRLMSKPYKRPLKNQAWRLLDGSNGVKRAEIIVGPKDSISKYVIRYVKRPRAIILSVLEGVTLDGIVGIDKDGNPTSLTSEAVSGQSCELDPILHPEILQRAVELAKAAYTGDLQSQVALGQASQTDVGAIQTSR